MKLFFNEFDLNLNLWSLNDNEKSKHLMKDKWFKWAYFKKQWYQ